MSSKNLSLGNTRKSFLGLKPSTFHFLTIVFFYFNSIIYQHFNNLLVSCFKYLSTKRLCQSYYPQPNFCTLHLDKLCIMFWENICSINPFQPLQIFSKNEDHEGHHTTTSLAHFYLIFFINWAQYILCNIFDLLKVKLFLLFSSSL